MTDMLYQAPVVPGPTGGARVPAARADKVLMGRLHLARRRRRLPWQQVVATSRAAHVVRLARRR